MNQPCHQDQGHHKQNTKWNVPLLSVCQSPTFWRSLASRVSLCHGTAWEVSEHEREGACSIHTYTCFLMKFRRVLTLALLPSKSCFTRIGPASL